MANAGPRKPAKGSSKRRPTKRTPNRSAAAVVERLSAEKEASDDKVFALTHRVATLESRERDLNELIVGHRERIAALESQREALAKDLEGQSREASRLHTRAEDLQGRIESMHGQVARLEVQRDTLQRVLTQEQANRTALGEREAELQRGLSERSERVAALEAEREALRKQFEGQKEEVAALREREHDVQGRMVSVHEQMGRLEVRGDMLNRALSDERNTRSVLEDQHAKLREQLDQTREHERDLLGKIAGTEAQINRLESERDTFERAAAEERQSNDSAVKEREEVLRTAREKERELQETLDAIRDQVNRLESERDTLKRALAEEQRKPAADAELKSARERQEELERTIESVREQTTEVESQRDELTAELDRAMAERDRMAARRDDVQRERERLSTRLEQLEGSRTYRLMRTSWRVRARIRHPFRRKRRPALSKATRSSQPKKSAPALPAPTAAPPKLKPIPRPTMRPKAAKRATRTEPTAPKTEQTAETRTEVDQATAAEVQPPPAASIDPERELWLARPQAPPTDVRKLRVAGVLDEMSAACFGPDCDLLRIDPEGWAEALEAHDPHFLLVESTWQGNNGSWQYMVASYTHPDYIGLPNLSALIAWCREREIPTVFWNKEDPVHFERFKEAAALFDYVFTTDANCIERYAELDREGTGPIEALQFAAQPRVHNPVGAPVGRSESPVFAGAYYRDRHIDRQHSLQMLLDAAMPFGLEIYDRRFGHEDQAFGFPERFKDRVKGALAYEEMIDAYKAHRVFLNVNSVTDSPTMFSRRVFELLACGTAVVSTESLGVEKTLGDVVSMVETAEQATEALTKLEEDGHWRELTQRGRRSVLGEHTYRHRLAEIANKLGFNVTAYSGEEVAALALVDDVDQARRFRAVVSSISAQETRPAELLIGSHTSVAGDLQELQSDDGEIRVRVVQQDANATRSQRFRELAALAASPWLAILHPAHTYGEHHVTDLVLTTRFVDADVIGNASYETLDGTGAVDRSLEHRFVESVHPHSVLVTRDLIARRGWPDELPEAGSALDGWFRDGVRIYSADAGNFHADAALGLPEQGTAARPQSGPEL